MFYDSSYVNQYQEKDVSIRAKQLCDRALTLNRNQKLIIPWPLKFEQGQDHWMLVIIDLFNNHAWYCDSASIELSKDTKAVVEM